MNPFTVLTFFFLFLLLAIQICLLIDATPETGRHVIVLVTLLDRAGRAEACALTVVVVLLFRCLGSSRLLVTLPHTCKRPIVSTQHLV